MDETHTAIADKPTNAQPRTRAARSSARRTARRRAAVLLVLALFGLLALIVLLAARPLALNASVLSASSVDVRPTTLDPGPARAAIARASRPETITIAAVGDMIFDRRVKALIARSGGAAPLASVADLLARADVTVGNLESPLSTRGVRNASKDVTFRGDPRGVEGLVLAGFDVVSLANNHVLDYGPDALAETITLLEEHGIAHAGAGADRARAWEPAFIETDGASVAFLSFSHILPAGFVATDRKAGLTQGRGNMDAVCSAIARAKERADYVLVSFHWGVEYQDDVNADQVRDAHRAIDAGADMVLSHHPHVIQAVERYRNGLIAYSLGDFVFDHYSRKTGEAFVLEAELGPDGVGEVRVVPVYLDTDGRPSVVQGSAARSILERLRDISRKRRTSVEITGDTARVLP